MGRDFCSVPDCDRPVFRGSLCAGHLKRLQRGRPLGGALAERLSLEERVLIVGSAWLEAEEDEDYERQRAAFLRAARDWLRAAGWRPPESKEG